MGVHGVDDNPRTVADISSSNILVNNNSNEIISASAISFHGAY